MARLLLHTFGSSGDVNPFLALGLELRERGHDVHFALSPSFAVKARALGFEATEAGPDMDMHSDLFRRMVAPEPMVAKAVHLLFGQVIIPAIASAVQTLEPLALDADLFVSHNIQLAAPAIASRTGVAWVTAFPAMTCYPTGRSIPNVAWKNPPAALARLAWRIGGHLLKSLDEQAAREYRNLGVPPLPNLLLGGACSRRLTLGLWSPSFFPRPSDWPPWLQVGGYARWDAPGILGRGEEALTPAARWPSPRLVPRRPSPGPSGEGEERLGRAILNPLPNLGEGRSLATGVRAAHVEPSAGHPRVLFTLGSSVVYDPRGFYETVLKASGPTDWRVILLGAPDDLPVPAELKDRVTALRYAPYADVFPMANAVVHSGGVGTTQAACYYGIPSVVVPRAFDQWENAAHIQREGWGLRLRPQDLSPYALRYRIERLLRDDKISRRVAALGERMRAEPGVSRSADRIEAALEP